LPRGCSRSGNCLIFDPEAHLYGSHSSLEIWCFRKMESFLEIGPFQSTSLQLLGEQALPDDFQNPLRGWGAIRQALFFHRKSIHFLIACTCRDRDIPTDRGF
jgi:hypothetical protein